MAKTARYDNGVEDSHSAPDSADDLGGPWKIDPYPQAEREREGRGDQVEKPVAFVVRRWTENELAKDRGIDAEERHECAEVDQGGSFFIIEQQRAREAENTDD